MSEPFVIDNSVVMAWCFEDETSPYSEAVLEHLAQGEAWAPAIWPLEVGNVLLVAERRKRLTRSESTRLLHLIRSLPIRVETESPERMFQEITTLARDRKLSTYDASYLDLAMRRGIPLATQDRALCQAARACRVSLLKP